jgi:hypothetical protein
MNDTRTTSAFEALQISHRDRAPTPLQAPSRFHARFNSHSMSPMARETESSPQMR